MKILTLFRQIQVYEVYLTKHINLHSHSVNNFHTTIYVLRNFPIEKFASKFISACDHSIIQLMKHFFSFSQKNITVGITKCSFYSYVNVVSRFYILKIIINRYIYTCKYTLYLYIYIYIIRTIKISLDSLAPPKQNLKLRPWNKRWFKHDFLWAP